MLLPYYKKGVIEAGCDEAGRGCLAGSVYAAAVILPPDYHNDILNDSKQLSEKTRYQLRTEIERDAVAWAELKVRPEFLIIDGNKFDPYYPDGGIMAMPHATIVKGDGKYLSIAAASILAKTYRDDYMAQLAEEYPQYDWLQNKGYPTEKHREAIKKYGPTPYHRMTFRF